MTRAGSGTPQVSVVVATLDRGVAAADLAVRLLEGQESCTFEVVVVDQTEHPDDLMIQRMTELATGADVRYFHATPASLPGARNYGVERATAEIILFLDDDVIPDAGLVSAHARAHSQSGQIACVAGLVRSLNAPTDRLFAFDWLGRGYGDFDQADERYTQTARGCNMSMKRSWITRVGGFDTRFVGNAYREESDMCFRLRKAGGLILFTPAAALLHLEADAGGCRELTSLHDSSNTYRNETLFFLKDWPSWRVPILLATVFATFVARRKVIAERAFGRRMRAFFMGMTQGFLAYYRGRGVVLRTAA